MYVVACLVCGDGPIVSGQLAKATIEADPQRLPSIVIDQLTTAGWRRRTSPRSGRRTGAALMDHDRDAPVPKAPTVDQAGGAGTSSRIRTPFDVGVLLMSATLSSGTSTFVSG